ncbi:MAG: hypothetical protein L6408_02880 [Nanoarchaeota archaeon]|nr:hypothetical protein [Nanoarchaeota archaeon]
MKLKNKLAKIAMVVGLTLGISGTSALASDILNDPDYIDKRIEEINKSLNPKKEKKEKGEDGYYFTIFSKEFEREYDIESKKADIWYETIFRKHGSYFNLEEGQYMPDNPSKSDWDWKNEHDDVIEKAFTSGIGEVLDEIEIFKKLVDWFDLYGSLNIIKENKGKTQLKDPSKGKNKYDRMEDDIDELKERKKDYESIGDYEEVERIEEMIDDLKDSLYDKRDFKLSFGVNTDFGMISDLIKDGFDPESYEFSPYTKLLTKRLNAKLSYDYNYGRTNLDLYRTFKDWDLDIRLHTDYQQSEGPQGKESGYLGLNNKLTVSQDFGDHLRGYVYHSRSWDVNKDNTGIGVSKVFTEKNDIFDYLELPKGKNGKLNNPVVFSINGNHNWQTNDYSASFKIEFKF